MRELTLWSGAVGPHWRLPAALTGAGRSNKGPVVLPPLHVAFAVFHAAAAPDCK